VPEYWADELQPKEGQKVFEGCYFTLAALQSNEQEHSRAMDYIRCAAVLTMGKVWRSSARGLRLQLEACRYSNKQATTNCTAAVDKRH
jgi:hypothetical protein